MNSIGGYFELELPQGEEYHKNAIRLNTGRNAFEYVLRAKKYKKVYLPYYTCDVMLEPIKKLQLDYEFYNIDEIFFPIFDFSKVKPLDVFVYTNYFGICDNQVQEVSQKCKNLIIDNSHAFFAKPLAAADTFYSPRKFFGLPDGAYLYTNKELEIELEQDNSLNRFGHLLGRVEEGAETYYNIFKENDISLIGQPIKVMSKLSKRLLHSIDYKHIAIQRIRNFLYLHEVLKDHNQLHFELKSDIVPMVYPLLIDDGSSLKKGLLQNKVFIATYWPNVLGWLKDEVFFEKYLYNNLIPLPVDQRYNEKEMLKIINLL
ncbi:MAG: hypothetical protein M0Q90_15865 [Bacteroidales bacterium]|nr:hypothetical protein [Bacteroidales bacterium]